MGFSKMCASQMFSDPDVPASTHDKAAILSVTHWIQDTRKDRKVPGDNFHESRFPSVANEQDRAS